MLEFFSAFRKAKGGLPKRDPQKKPLFGKFFRCREEMSVRRRRRREQEDEEGRRKEEEGGRRRRTMRRE